MKGWPQRAAQQQPIERVFARWTHKQLLRAHCQFTLVPRDRGGYAPVPHLAPKNRGACVTQSLPRAQTNRAALASVQDPYVAFLGTGSMLPSNFRNVSSALIDFGEALFLVDCGEGTLEQLQDHY